MEFYEKGILNLHISKTMRELLKIFDFQKSKKKKKLKSNVFKIFIYAIIPLFSRTPAFFNS